MITTRPRPLYPGMSHYLSKIHCGDNWLKTASIREVPGSKMGQNTDYPFAAKCWDSKLHDATAACCHNIALFIHCRSVIQPYMVRVTHGVLK